MASNIGRIITDFYCNGFFGREYDNNGARVEAEGYDWVVIRKSNNQVELGTFKDETQKESYLNNWTQNE